VILLVAALFCSPFLLFGVFSWYGGDSWTHAEYVYDFSRQFWHGEVYPRWLTSANEGYGSPIFFVQYPLPYFITALLRPLTFFPTNALREAHELGVFCFLMLAAAGFAARRWFRNSCTPWAATIASLVYISLPFILGETLGWTAIGQLCAFVWMPLALCFCESIQPRFVVVASLGVILALLLLSHVLTGILFLPLMLAYTVFGCEKSSHISMRARIASVLLALCIGVGISAVYLFPLVAYRNLFDVAGMQYIYGGFEIGRWFAYVTWESLSSRVVLPLMICTVFLTLITVYYVWHARGAGASRILMILTLVLGAVALAPGLGSKLIQLSGFRVSTSTWGNQDVPARILCTLLSTAVLGIVAYCHVSEGATRKRAQVLVFGTCGTFLLTLPWSAFVWKAIPPLANFQFPFRLGTILSVAVAGLFAVALDSCLREPARRDRALSQGVVIFSAIAVVGLGLLTWRVDWRFRHHVNTTVDAARNGLVDVMYRSYVPRAQVVEFASDLGGSPDKWDVVPKHVDQGVNAAFTEGRGFVKVDRIGPRVIHVSIQCLDDAHVKIGQVYMPLWKVVPTRQYSSVPVLRRSADGLVEVVLGPGLYEFNLVFDGGAAEKYGVILTLVSIGVVVSGLTVQYCRRWLWAAIRVRPQTRTSPNS